MAEQVIDGKNMPSNIRVYEVGQTPESRHIFIEMEDCRMKMEANSPRSILSTEIFYGVAMGGTAGGAYAATGDEWVGYSALAITAISSGIALFRGIRYHRAKNRIGELAKQLVNGIGLERIVQRVPQ